MKISFLSIFVIIIVVFFIIPVIEGNRLLAINNTASSIFLKNLANQKYENFPKFEEIDFKSSNITVINSTFQVENIRIPIQLEKINNNTSIFEGDILVSKNIDTPEGKAAIQNFAEGLTKPWRNGNIPIAIDPDLSNSTRLNIYKALETMINTFSSEDIHLNFTIAKNQANILYITNANTGCFSQFIGMYPNFGGLLRLSEECKSGDIVHEFGHVFGLWHEQTRCDFKDHIILIDTNIHKEKISQFQAKCDPSDPEHKALSPISHGDYDFCSIMHYPFFINQRFAIEPSKPVIEAKETVNCSHIGHQKNFSEGDLSAIYETYSFVS
jgi:hypothetical protein